MSSNLDEEPTLERVYQALSLTVDQVLCVYLFGSRLYGTVTQQSDWDYVVVVQDGSLEDGKTVKQVSVKDELIDGCIYTESKFLDLIANHDLSVFGFLHNL
eukprot:TRINITY_DN8_c0_g1_i10.p1 TRINITY_DN8_c0_g1~~TRINITY_DN8_c0_g1_i10.p1  ORF type:complete len:101 (+),score=20.73 TRINITY_DN8_c0_g1_i10:73-375(+)